MADVKNFKPRLSSSRMFNYVKGESKDFDNGKVDDKFYNFMTSSYEKQEHLNDFGMFAFTAPLIYQLDLLKEDLDDIHTHLSESKFTNKKQKFPVVDVTNEFYVTGTTKLEGDTTIEGFTDIKGDFKVNGAVVSNLKPSLEFSDSLRAKTLVSSSAQISSDISGSFTSLSASIATDINNAGGGTIDSTLKNGSTNAVQNDAIYDEFQKKLSLTGGVMTGLIRPIVTAVTSAPKNNLLDAQKTNVFEFAAGKAITISSIIPAFPGQEITIMNIGTGAVTLTGTSSPNARNIYSTKGGNYTISQHQARKLVSNQNGIWYMIS
jgi:hypothetical protein